MPDQTPHTPGPWEVNPLHAYRSPTEMAAAYSIVGAEDAPYDTMSANAEFIARACNAHDRLLRVAEWLLERLPEGIGGPAALREIEETIALAKGSTNVG